MSALTDLAMDIATVPELAKLPQKVVPFEPPPGPEQDAEKIEIDFGRVVVSIFHKNGPYLFTKEGLKSGWHYHLSTYTHDHQPAGPMLLAEETAIDKMIQYLRERVKEYGLPKADEQKPT